MFRILASVPCLSVLALAQVAQGTADERGSGAAGGAPALVTASYTLFGDSCGSSCASLNDTRAAGRTGTLPNEYAFGHRFTSATVIAGFQLYTRTNTLPEASMTCSLYRESATVPGTPDATPAASGTLTALNTLDFYGVLLSQPVTVNANETVWIAQSDSTNILAAGLAAAGVSPAVATYWRRTGLNWATTGSVLYPAWRIICGGDLAFFNSAPPRLGGTTNLTIQGGPATAPVVLLFGVANPNLPTPFCTRLYSSLDVSLPFVTDASGRASFTLNIPNNPSWDGAILWNQWWALTSAGALGTNGGRAQLGT
jgi:hypothetical protein